MQLYRHIDCVLHCKRSLRMIQENEIIVNNNVGYLKFSQTHANLFFLNERGLDELQVTLLYHILLQTNDSVHE